MTKKVWHCTGWLPLKVSPIKLTKCICGGIPRVHYSALDDAIRIDCENCGISTFVDKATYNRECENDQRQYWNIMIKKLRAKKYQEDLRSGKLATYIPRSL